MKHFLLSVLLVAGTMTTSWGQLKTPSLSPGVKITQDFSVSSIELSYSRPSVRGRKIFGDLIPYGRAWRTGANAPTKIKIGEDLEIAGQKVKAGEYVMYSIPGRDKWEVILNTGTTKWTADGYTRENDVARFMIKPTIMGDVCQTFSINITDITFTTCKIEMMWERTKIVLPVTARNSESVEVSIDKAINHPAAPPYFQAANYYYEADRKMDIAKTYVDKALQEDPKAYYMWYLKARIEKKLGNLDDAITAAKKSIETSKGTPAEDEYFRNNTRVIDDVNKMRPRRQQVDRP